MLDTNIKSQLKAYFERILHPIELLASVDEGSKSAEMLALLEDIASLSDKISLRRDGADARKPSFAIGRAGEAARVSFAGLPMGHEFNSLILALLQVGGHPPKESADALAQAKSLKGTLRFETYFSLSCQNCPDVVQALNLVAAINPHVEHVAVDGALFQSEVDARKIMAVPSIYLNGEPFGQGRMSLEQILAKLDTGAEARAAEKVAAQAPFDVLVVGGGPAGAAAAVYAARKGIRTGIAAERFGGQVLQDLRRGHHEPAAGRGTDPGRRPGPAHGAPRERRGAPEPQRHPLDRRALAGDERTRRARVSRPRRRLLPAL